MVFCTTVGYINGRYILNKKHHKDYERGLNDAKKAYRLDNIVDFYNIGNYKYKLGKYLRGAQLFQRNAHKCCIDISFKQEKFLKLLINHEQDNKINETIYKNFINTVIEIENE